MKGYSSGIRAGVRIPVELPVLLHWKSRSGSLREARGMTGNMSGNGLFIVAPVRLRHDTQISFTVQFPPEVTKTPVQLWCRGRVVRQPSPRPALGIGAIIDDYELRRGDWEV